MMRYKLALARWEYTHPDKWILDCMGYRAVVEKMDGTDYVGTIKTFKEHTYHTVVLIMPSKRLSIAQRRCLAWMDEYIPAQDTTP